MLVIASAAKINYNMKYTVAYTRKKEMQLWLSATRIAYSLALTAIPFLFLVRGLGYSIRFVLTLCVLYRGDVFFWGNGRSASFNSFYNPIYLLCLRYSRFYLFRLHSRLLCTLFDTGKRSKA